MFPKQEVQEHAKVPLQRKKKLNSEQKQMNCFPALALQESQPHQVQLILTRLPIMEVPVEDRCLRIPASGGAIGAGGTLIVLGKGGTTTCGVTGVISCSMTSGG